VLVGFGSIFRIVVCNSVVIVLNSFPFCCCFLCVFYYMVELEELNYVEIIPLGGINRIFMLHIITLICVKRSIFTASKA
jgi:hypothetical protein